MSRRGTDDVFLFTLVDLLVQICFFGLVAFVGYQAIQSVAADASKAKLEQERAALKAAGVSSLTELTDELSRLAPMKELKGFSEYYNKGGKIESAMAAAEVVSNEGGVDKLKNRLEKLRKLEEGFGKPPCLFDQKDGKRIDRAVATVVATDTHIEFIRTTPEFEQMLALVGGTYAAVKYQTLNEFSRAFSSLREKRPDCLYLLEFYEKTRYVEARDAARSFRLSIRRQ